MDGFDSKTSGRASLDYPWGDTVPEVGDTIEIAPGLHWVRMPLPFSLKWINLWLVDDGERGWTVVDTGVPTDETKVAWRNIFDTKLGGRPVWRVIITHMHPDHIGLAGWMHRKFGAELWISRLEYVTCRMLVADTGREAPEAGVQFYREAGWDEAALERYTQRFGGFGQAVTRLPDAYKRLEDGDALDLGGQTWRVIVGSGHSPEHACLFCEALNILISGDQILPRISSNVSVFPTEPAGDPLKDWMDSCLKLIDALPEDVLVLPAHNEPFRGAHDRLRALHTGHAKSLERLKRRLGESPRRVTDTFPALFGRKIEGGVLGMATGEALAHLNRLIAEGDVVKEVDADGVALYRLA